MGIKDRDYYWIELEKKRSKTNRNNKLNNWNELERLHFTLPGKKNNLVNFVAKEVFYCSLALLILYFLIKRIM